MTIKVTDEDEAPENMARRAWLGEHGSESMEGDLAMSGSSGVPYDENGTADAALAPWTLDGDAAGDFSNNAGMLTFSGSPDYEMPAGANTDNTCMVAVK